MAFSIEDHVVIANIVSFDQFLKEEASRYNDFISTCRTEFHIAVDRYFSSFHELSDEQLQKKRDVVIIFSLLRLFNL